MVTCLVFHCTDKNSARNIKYLDIVSMEKIKILIIYEKILWIFNILFSSMQYKTMQCNTVHII